jgi:outer membrane protein, heavy metal efflux system
LADLRRVRRVLTLYDSSLIPQAEQSFHSVRAAYQVGKVEFQTLLQAELLLLRLETELHRLEADHQQAIASLELLVGLSEREIREQLPGAAGVYPILPRTLEDNDAVSD